MVAPPQKPFATSVPEKRDYQWNNGLMPQAKVDDSFELGIGPFIAFSFQATEFPINVFAIGYMLRVFKFRK